jgi:DNA replication and repair protein RecF
VRNLQPLELVPRERFNVFVGDNGQGKTNLLETIFVVATLRSFRTSRLADLVAFGEPRATIGARVLREDMSRLYEIELAPGSRKIRLDGKVPRPLAKYFGGFNVVVFTPEDLALPRGSPGERRRFLDRGVFNLDPSYLGIAQDYERVLKTRNTVLRKAAEGGMPARQLDELLAVYDEQLAKLAVEVVAARKRFLGDIAGLLAEAFAAITRAHARVTVRYVDKTPASDAAELVVKLRESRARDLATQSTQVGPHRDDLAFELDTHDAGGFASQGQLRAIMLAWKTAELQVLARSHGDSPILLLDDVSSELDAARNRYLFEHLANLAGQCFITTTHGSHVLLTADRADYRIENGLIFK